MTKIIIDGYNMIHLVAELRQFLNESLERARDELIAKLKSYLLNKKVLVTVVFDGAHPTGVAPTERNRHLEIRFSNYPFKADPLIKKLIQKEENKGALTIVTRDSEIIAFAKAEHATTIAPEEFWVRLTKRQQQNGIFDKFDRELSADELAEWKDIFGLK
ncbi:MAG TPA: NYN domain-containing protein [bacterium]